MSCRGSGILNRFVRESLTENIVFEGRPKKVREQIIKISVGGTFQAEEGTSTKVLRSKCAL